MTRRLRVLSRAEGDADDIFRWLAKRSPAGAVAWSVALKDRLASLNESGWSGSPAPEAAAVGVDLRQAFFKTRRGRTYRVLFLAKDDEMIVLRIRGPGQRAVRHPDLPLGDV